MRLIVISCAANRLERLVSRVTHYVSSVMLNSTHLIVFQGTVDVCTIRDRSVHVSVTVLMLSVLSIHAYFRLLQLVECCESCAVCLVCSINWRVTPVTAGVLISSCTVVCVKHHRRNRSEAS